MGPLYKKDPVVLAVETPISPSVSRFGVPGLGP